ncbi:unnamed protein product [marine sediment metagenome]|uniref:Uncharacterized protein n=1 Tax=marine sediment metagenome TaxID=412755 RepID=X1T6C9_9ZZZZ
MNQFQVTIRENTPVFGLGILIVKSVGKIAIIFLLGFCETTITIERR